MITIKFDSNEERKELKPLLLRFDEIDLGGKFDYKIKLTDKRIKTYWYSKEQRDKGIYKHKNTLISDREWDEITSGDWIELSCIFNKHIKLLGIQDEYDYASKIIIKREKEMKNVKNNA